MREMEKRGRQEDFLEYAEQFADCNQVHVWLGGSFLNGNFSEYSDIDLSAQTDEAEMVRKLIYGYPAKPIYLSKTRNPEGIIIVIFEDGIALDLEILKKVDANYRGRKLPHGEYKDSMFFHRDDVKKFCPVRDEKMWEHFVFCRDIQYEEARLLHRSLIKYLSGKTEAAYGILREISDGLEAGRERPGAGEERPSQRKDSAYKINSVNYVDMFKNTLSDFEKKYRLPLAYRQEIMFLVFEATRNNRSCNKFVEPI